MEGKTVIITGGNRGIGKETAKKVSGQGARVILACRNVEVAFSAAKEIVEETKNPNVVVKKLDLSSLKSVRAFAEGINETEERLDVLLHNAGIVTSSFQTSEDNLELTMATNHFGLFLLTHLLIDLLKKSATSRIVITSSNTHLIHTLDLENPSLQKLPVLKIPQMLYCDSKFANICFTKELDSRLRETGVTVNCFHPGLINTEIWQASPSPLYWLLRTFSKWCLRTAEQGSRTGVFLACSKEVENISGKYFVDCVEASVGRNVGRQVTEKLWAQSEKLVKLSKTDPKI